jgi:hypothetical protein
MDPDQTARMRRLVWIHAGRKPIMLVLSWRGSYIKWTCLSIKLDKTIHNLRGKIQNMLSYYNSNNCLKVVYSKQSTFPYASGKGRCTWNKNTQKQFVRVLRKISFARKLRFPTTTTKLSMIKCLNLEGKYNCYSFFYCIKETHLYHLCHKVAHGGRQWTMWLKVVPICRFIMSGDICKA